MNIESSLRYIEKMMRGVGATLVLLGFLFILVGVFTGYSSSSFLVDVMVMGAGNIMLGLGVAMLATSEDSPGMFIASAIWAAISACVLFSAIYERARELGYNVPF